MIILYNFRMEFLSNLGCQESSTSFRGSPLFWCPCRTSSGVWKGQKGLHSSFLLFHSVYLIIAQIFYGYILKSLVAENNGNNYWKSEKLPPITLVKSNNEIRINSQTAYKVKYQQNNTDGQNKRRFTSLFDSLRDQFLSECERQQKLQSVKISV